MYSLEDDVETEKPTLQDTQETPLPSAAVADARTMRATFALGEESPGPEALKTAISTGEEPALRRKIAQDEDRAIERMKQNIISTMAKQNGGKLTDEDVNVVQSLTSSEIKTDPGSVLEKKFSDRYINYVLAKQDEVKEDAFRAAQHAGDLTTDLQVLHKRREDLETKYQSETGWGKAIWLHAVQMLPVIPWWRQAQALEKRPGHGAWGMGQSMADNVRYWWALPPEQRGPELDRALKAFEDAGQPLDAKTFLDSLISFSASEQFLANSMSVADYGTGASMFWKLGSRLLKGGKEVVKGVGSEVVTEPPRQLTYKAPLLLEDMRPRGAENYKIQGELFGEQPMQGSFRFMTGPEQLPPLLESKLPPGKLRATYDPVPREPKYPGRDIATGRMVRRPTQNDLPLDAPVHQTDIFATGPKSQEAKYAASKKTDPFTPEESPKGVKHASEPPMSPKERAAWDAYNKAMDETKKARQARVALADAVKAISEPNAKPREVLSQLGDTAQAGFLGALEHLKKPLHERGLYDLALAIPTFANPAKFYESSKVLGREYGQRVVQHMMDQGSDLIGVLNGTARPERLTPQSLAIAQEKASVALKNDYLPRIQNGSLDFEYVPAEATMWNVDTMIGWVGKNDATLPTSQESAHKWARDVYQLGEHEYIVQQQGNGWKIGVFKHLDETDPFVRDGMIANGNRAGDGVIKMLFNRLVSADYLLPPIQRANRSIATHASQNVRKALADIIQQDIYKPLSKTEMKELNKVLVRNRDEPSDKFPGQRGRWYETAAEFEQVYNEVNRHLPSPEVIKAYDTFRRVSDFDWMMRNFNVYRDKARLGIETWRFSFDEAGTAKRSGFFEGKAVSGIPWTLRKADQDAGIWIYNSETKKGEFRYKFDMSDDERKALDEMISDKGFRVIQIADPRTHPLDGIAYGKNGDKINDQINFVVTNTWEKAPLSWKQVDYRPGGHVVYPGKFYIAQPVIKIGRNGKESYFGDNNILNVGTQAEAEKWAQRLDDIRILLKSGKYDEAEAYRRAMLPHSPEQIQALFLQKISPLSLDHPVVYKEAGRNTLDTVSELSLRYPDIPDTTRNVYDLTNYMDKAFLAERDNIMSTVKEVGGVHTLVPAEQLDPYQALTKAMGQGLRNTWMGDYKLSAAENFLKDFEDVLKPSRDQLAAHPIYWVYHPQWADNADPSRVAAAKAAQRAIATFLGQQSELAKNVGYIENKIYSSIYNTLGQKGLNAVDTVADFTDRMGLSSIKDPVNFLRAVAFHTNLGFFSPVQLFVQAQSMTHILGVAGLRNGMPGVAAGVLASVSRLNPEMIQTLAKKSKAFGWKEKDFVEMIETMKSSGVYNVGGEAAFRDDVFDLRLFKSTAGHIIDKGTFFFDEGERLVRLSAYATAFREFKAANGGAKVTQRDMLAIQERFKTLSVQMARDSNAAWQQGVFSVPTQFFAFNARLLEQFLGNRLTGAEKLRALATYSTVYGIPVTAGIMTMGTSPIPGIPTSYEDIKEEAARRGIDMSPLYLQAMSEGLMSVALHYATGREYNTASRYGPGASTAISNLMRQDKTFMDIAFGASGTIMKDLWKASAPFTHAVASIFKDNGEYPVMADDWVSLIRNLKVADIGVKAYTIAQYGKWITKTGTEVGPANGLDAVMVFAGLTPMQIQDAYTGMNALKHQKEGQAAFAKDALENIKNGVAAGAKGDYKTMDSFFKRARTAIVAGDFNYEDEAKIFKRAVDLHQDLGDKVNWELYQQSTKSQQDGRLDQYLRKRQ